MKDIQLIRKKFEEYFAMKCFGCKSISQCPKGEKCECKILADIKAYMYAIIKHPYYKYTIWDFDGLSDSNEQERILDKDIVVAAKEQVLKYCWKGVTLQDLQENIFSKDSLELDHKSIIDHRRKNGTNVVIYASDSTKSGKTFVASLIMREAIKRRAIPDHNMESYDWVSFEVLKSYIISNSDNISYLKNADWLVVDDVPRMDGASRSAEQFITSKIDPFFTERLENRLPTIFVFRFDINTPSIRWEESYGVGISTIVKDSHTFKICLG